MAGGEHLQDQLLPLLPLEAEDVHVLRLADTALDNLGNRDRLSLAKAVVWLLLGQHRGPVHEQPVRRRFSLRRDRHATGGIALEVGRDLDLDLDLRVPELVRVHLVRYAHFTLAENLGPDARFPAAHFRDRVEPQATQGHLRRRADGGAQRRHDNDLGSFLRIGFGLAGPGGRQHHAGQAHEG